jgi:hypothetical protein
MTTAEYVLALISIISGLAICDILASLNRLLRLRKKVRWDWLPLGAAALATFGVVNSWFVSWRLTKQAGYNPQLWSFCIVLIEETLLFLMASAVLPDEVPQEGIDLRAYYEEMAPYFWTLFALGGGAFLLTDAFVPTAGVGVSLSYLPTGVALGLSVLGAALLVFAKARRTHQIVLGLLLVLAFGVNFNERLNG